MSDGAEAAVRVPLARRWKAAALWLLFLAPFFYATYGFANWLASRRGDVGSIMFDWERHIPFLEWTIVPYWSINAFYGLSLFVAGTAREHDPSGLHHVRAVGHAQRGIRVLLDHEHGRPVV